MTEKVEKVVQNVVNLFDKLTHSEQGDALRLCQRSMNVRLQREREVKEKAAKEAWNLICNKHEWRVKPQKVFNVSGSGRDGVYVQKRVKEDLFRDYAEKFGSSESNDWEGMFYVRTDENILIADSGGTLVLKTPLICSDEDWATICSGNIPDRYIR
jgi:hypothetical protein